MTIAVNLVRDNARNRRFQFWRNTQRAAVDSALIAEWLPDRRISPEQKALINEQVQAVWNATASLSDKQKTVFLLRFVEDLDILEISEATGLSESAVNVHLFRAVRAIRRRVRRNHD
jgi:RNA polymerase sigma-70 factor (ECF subfamily)